MTKPVLKWRQWPGQDPNENSPVWFINCGRPEIATIRGSVADDDILGVLVKCRMLSLDEIGFSLENLN